MRYNIKEIISLSLDIGEHLIKSGAEISRVEETISIICKNYGIKYMEVFAMNSLIVVTLRHNEETVTESRRIKYHKTNLYRLEKLNDLSRNICKENISRKEVLKEIDNIKEYNNKYLPIIGSLLASSAFTLFFKGTLLDALCALLISIVLLLINNINKKLKINNLINNFNSSFIIGLLAITLTKIGLGNNFDKIIIGDIMLLIPGLSMFISINDIFKGDTMSGIDRFTEGIFIALTIAAGTGFSLLLLGGIL